MAPRVRVTIIGADEKLSQLVTHCLHDTLVVRQSFIDSCAFLAKFSNCALGRSMVVPKLFEVLINTSFKTLETLSCGFILHPQMVLGRHVIISVIAFRCSIHFLTPIHDTKARRYVEQYGLGNSTFTLLTV